MPKPCPSPGLPIRQAHGPEPVEGSPAGERRSRPRATARLGYFLSPAAGLPADPPARPRAGRQAGESLSTSLKALSLPKGTKSEKDSRLLSEVRGRPNPADGSWRASTPFLAHIGTMNPFGVPPSGGIGARSTWNFPLKAGHRRTRRCCPFLPVFRVQGGAIAGPTIRDGRKLRRLLDAPPFDPIVARILDYLGRFSGGALRQCETES